MVRAIMTLSWIALVSAACGGAESSEFGDPAAPASSRPQGTPLWRFGPPRSRGARWWRISGNRRRVRGERKGRRTDWR